MILQLLYLQGGYFIPVKTTYMQWGYTGWPMENISVFICVDI